MVEQQVVELEQEGGCDGVERQILCVCPVREDDNGRDRKDAGDEAECRTAMSSSIANRYAACGFFVN